MKDLKLAIVILQHNTPQDVSENLQHLNVAYLPKESEVVVINNGGNKANSKIPKDSHNSLNVKFYETPNHGFPTGNNFGLSKLSQPKEYYDYICFLNPDIKVTPDTFQKLINYMQQHPKVGLTSPTLKYPDGIIQDNYRVFPKPIDLIIKRIPLLRKNFPDRMRKYLMWDRNPTDNQPIDWVVGAFTLLSREAIEAIQKHDDDYFLFMSDVVMCRQIWENQLEVHIVGEAEALHDDTRLSHGGLIDLLKSKLIRIHIKDAIKYFRKYSFKPLPKNSPSSQL